ncbi:MAG: N-acetyltransferase family protein [Candidatus Kapaibacterium sp.]
MQLKIRKAELDDIDIITDCNIALALETEGLNLDRRTVRHGVKRLLENGLMGFYLIAEVEGNPAGQLLITTEWSDWRDGILWWIQSVYVQPSFREKGIYGNMYKTVKEMASNNADIRGFRLYVEKGNRPAIAVYEALGMKETHYKMYKELF